MVCWTDGDFKKDHVVTSLSARGRQWMNVRAVTHIGNGGLASRKSCSMEVNESGNASPRIMQQQVRSDVISNPFNVGKAV